MTGLGQLVGAILLIASAGLFAAIDAAVSTVSMARVEELVRDDRPGSVRLLQVMRDRPRYINLVVLLRAEGGPDPRGRVRVGTVLVSPIEPEPEDTEDSAHE